MGRDLPPEDVLRQMEKGRRAPYYLFYGAGEFRLEKALERIRDRFIPDSARDFNLEILYGGEIEPAEVMNRALSFPFMAENRLIIVRRVEKFHADQLEKFLSYLENPAPATCLIFVAGKPDFRKKFYKAIRDKGRAIHFQKLRDHQLIPWLQRTARTIGFKMDTQACDYLVQITGNSPRDLYVELEKLHVRHGNATIGMEKVKELAIHSRIYSIFELINAISAKDPAAAIGILRRFLEEEDQRKAPLQIIGMLNRQLRLIWQTKETMAEGGATGDVARQLGRAGFAARDMMGYARLWSAAELENGFDRLYEADGQIKSGSRPNPILESLILTLCRKGVL